MELPRTHRRTLTMRRHLPHLLLLATLLATSLPAAAAEAAAAGDEPAVVEIGPAVGSEAPPFTLQTLDGGDLSLSDFRGKAPVVLVFFRGEW
jgi:cytochrome oxidase Cu insertion factor (SCO1/SenC/PrrC family)